MQILVAIFSENASWAIPPEWMEELRRRYPDITFTHATSWPQVYEQIAEADAAYALQMNDQAIRRARRLRWLHSPAAGVARLLTPAVVASPIVVTNSRGMHAVNIAEHVIGITIALTRRLEVALRQQVAHVWNQEPFVDVPLLRGRRMGVVGLGAIGREVATLASALGMRVSAIRRRPQSEPVAGVEQVGGPEALTGLLQASDVVVLAAPSTPETRGMIGSTELGQMKKSAFLINIARGRLVRQDELVAALRAGTIAGAGLDVFEHEPLDPGSPLWDMPNVIITPHTSGFRADYWEAAFDLFGQNLERFRAGQALINVVDKKAGY